MAQGSLLSSDHIESMVCYFEYSCNNILYHDKNYLKDFTYKHNYLKTATCDSSNQERLDYLKSILEVHEDQLETLKFIASQKPLDDRLKLIRKVCKEQPELAPQSNIISSSNTKANIAFMEALDAINKKENMVQGSIIEDVNNVIQMVHEKVIDVDLSDELVASKIQQHFFDEHAVRLDIPTIKMIKNSDNPKISLESLTFDSDSELSSDDDLDDSKSEVANRFEDNELADQKSEVANQFKADEPETSIAGMFSEFTIGQSEQKPAQNSLTT